MKSKTYRRLARFKRHFNVMGDHIVAIYDTAIRANYTIQDPLDVSIAVPKSIWDEVLASSGAKVIKHPLTGVECIRVLGDILVRKSTLTTQTTFWSKDVGCRAPHPKDLHDQFQAVITNSRSNKKTIAHVEAMANTLERLMRSGDLMRTL